MLRKKTFLIEEAREMESRFADSKKRTSDTPTFLSVAYLYFFPRKKMPALFFPGKELQKAELKVRKKLKPGKANCHHGAQLVASDRSQ